MSSIANRKALSRRSSRGARKRSQKAAQKVRRGEARPGKARRRGVQDPTRVAGHAGLVGTAEQMAAVYVFVDDWLKANPALARWRRSNNGRPAFTDAEAITLGLMQCVLGVATLKAAYRLVARDHAGAFPRLPTYQQWLARLHALSAVVGALIQAATLRHQMRGRFYLMDSKPIPVCKPVRHGRARLLREEGANFGKTKAGWFFGFKLHAITHRSGAILAVVLTPANWADRDVALALAWSVQGGVALGDHGYDGRELHGLLWDQARMLMVTPKVAGALGRRRDLISSLREQVETTFSALWNRFVDRVYSRSWEGLWSTIKLKVLHFDLCKVGILPA